VIEATFSMEKVGKREDKEIAERRKEETMALLRERSPTCGIPITEGSLRSY
jgi:hypothetical protein